MKVLIVWMECKFMNRVAS
uniref:Uncharacterized protein n=1 Tax=Rhizophora mucronata TaxID=61149 RepID=A0A2P2Q707_RHIMU